MDASLKQFVLKCYDERISLAEMPSEMRLALKDSKKVPAFLFNITAEIERLPIHLQKQEKIRSVVDSFTDWFLMTFKKHADEKQMSEVAKRALQEKENKKQIIETAIDTGVITEEAFDVIEETARTRSTD